MRRRDFLVGSGAVVGWLGVMRYEDAIMGRDSGGNPEGQRGESAATNGDGDVSVEHSESDDTDGVVLNHDAVRAAFRDRFNAVREDKGLRTVFEDEILTAMAADHADNMATHDYIGHVQPDGTTVEDRYRQRGLLPGCELEIPGSDEYYPGAENAAGAALGTQVTHPGMDGTMAVLGDGDLAEFLLDSWLTSPPHRDVMLLPTVNEIGLGISRRGRDVWAALTFC